MTAGQPAYLYVKNWDELQHYTKRNPPWIKLYRRLLNEGDFMFLDEIEQWQLVRVWLVSAEEHPGGWVKNDQSWLRRMTGTLRPIPVQKFVDQGWLKPRSQAEYDAKLASTVLAPVLAPRYHLGRNSTPELPPRDIEVNKEPSLLPSTSIEDTEGTEGNILNGEHHLPDISAILKEMPA